MTMPSRCLKSWLKFVSAESKRVTAAVVAVTFDNDTIANQDVVLLASAHRTGMEHLAESQPTYEDVS